MAESVNDSANPYAPPGAPVRDIAANGDAVEPAGRGVRLGAAILDGLVFALLVYIPLGIGVGVSALATLSIDWTQGGVIGGVAGAFVGLLIYIYFTVRFVRANGQTICKRWLGIKVLRSDGNAVSLGRLFWLRNAIIGAVSFIPVIGAIIGLVDALMIFGEKRRCLHDLIADTMVVKA